MPAFVRHIGIDNSGAQTPPASLNGLRVFMIVGDRAAGRGVAAALAEEYWTRRGISEWLVDLGALPPGRRNCPLCFPCASQSRFLGSSAAR
ncbi:MAG: hypothetical protein WCC90_04930 [Methylocella sp.]